MKPDTAATLFAAIAVIQPAGLASDPHEILEIFNPVANGGPYLHSRRQPPKPSPVRQAFALAIGAWRRRGRLSLRRPLVRMRPAVPFVLVTALALLLFSGGCAVDRLNFPDGASYERSALFQKLDVADIQFTKDATGYRGRVRGVNSGVDAEAMSAVVGAAVKAAVRP